MRMLTEGILRARYRNGFDREALLTPGQAVELTLDLGATGNVFLPGHRIRLEVSSSNFPRFDRNPNTGGVFGKDAQPVAATQTVYHDRGRALAARAPHRSSFLRARARADILGADLPRANLGVSPAAHRASAPVGHRGCARGRALPGIDSSRGGSRSRGRRVPGVPLGAEEGQCRHPLAERRNLCHCGNRPILGIPIALTRSSNRPGSLIPGPAESKGTSSMPVTAFRQDYEGIDARGKDRPRSLREEPPRREGGDGRGERALPLSLFTAIPKTTARGRGPVWPEGPYRGAGSRAAGKREALLVLARRRAHAGGRGDERRAPPRPGEGPDSSADSGGSALGEGSVEDPRVLPRGRRAGASVEVEMEDGLKPIRNVVATLRGTKTPDRWIVLGHAPRRLDVWRHRPRLGDGGASRGRVRSGLDGAGWPHPGSLHRLLLLGRRGVRPRGLDGVRGEDDSTSCARRRSSTSTATCTTATASPREELRRCAISCGVSLPTFPGIEPPEDLEALGSGADFVPFQDFVGLPTLSLELLFRGGWSFGAYHSNYDNRYWMMRHGDEEFPPRRASRPHPGDRRDSTRRGAGSSVSLLVLRNEARGARASGGGVELGDDIGSSG